MKLIKSIAIFLTLAIAHLPSSLWADWIEQVGPIKVNWSTLEGLYTTPHTDARVASQNAIELQLDYPNAASLAYRQAYSTFKDFALPLIAKDKKARRDTVKIPADFKWLETAQASMIRSNTTFSSQGEVTLDFKIFLATLFASLTRGVDLAPASLSKSDNNVQGVIFFGQGLTPVSEYKLQDEFGNTLLESRRLSNERYFSSLMGTWHKSLKNHRLKHRVGEKPIKIRVLHQLKDRLVISRQSWRAIPKNSVEAAYSAGRVALVEDTNF